MENLSEKKQSPEIPYFRQKPPMLRTDGFLLFFKEINKVEYWICEQQQNKNLYLVQWMEVHDSKYKTFHSAKTNTNGLNVENKKRNNSLIQILNTKSK